MSSWADTVLQSIQELHIGGGRQEIVTPLTVPTRPAANQFVILLKPEATSFHQGVDVIAILDYFYRAVMEARIFLDRTQVISASCLDEYGIISEHYGVINQVSVSGASALTPEYRASLNALKGTSRNAQNAPILGGHQFLDEYTSFNPEALADLAKQEGTTKIGPGIYLSLIPVEDEYVGVLNAFHPEQLLHFTRPGATTVVIDATSDRRWTWLRQRFVGTTDPQTAAPDSLRHWALQNRRQLGLQEVSANRNLFHVSAGPVEGLAELRRFFGPPLLPEFDYSKTVFGGSLLKIGVPTEAIDRILANPLIHTSTGEISLFDLTEELDSPRATALIPTIAESITRESP
jgi:hypothetical protein